MKKQFVGLLGAVLAVALGLTACGGDSSTPADGGSDKGSAGSQPTIEMATSPFGELLTDADGRTLYMFVPDKGSDSTCYGDCAKAWPALTVKDDPVAGTSLDDALMGTSERKDGSLQVTYNSLPLYHFAFDKKPGDINGQGSGGVWWVVSPKGDPIKQ